MTSPANKEPGERSSPVADKLPLPHERDQRVDSPATQGAEGPRGLIQQAERDVRRGLRDTDRRGVPSDVPGPGVPPENSPGAAVPEDGVDIAGESRHSVIPQKSPKP